MSENENQPHEREGEKLDTQIDNGGERERETRITLQGNQDDVDNGKISSFSRQV